MTIPSPTFRVILRDTQYSWSPRLYMRTYHGEIASKDSSLKACACRDVEWSIIYENVYKNCVMEYLWVNFWKFMSIIVVINVCEDVWYKCFWKLVKIWKFFLIERCFMKIYNTNVYENFILFMWGERFYNDKKKICVLEK